MLLPKKQNKKNYKSLSGIYLKSRHESPANSSDKSESVNCAKALQYARLPGSLTVEAAFVAPWIILAAIVLCSLFQYSGENFICQRRCIMLQESWLQK